MNLRAGIVRILKPNGTISGTGFVVANSLIVTCAHVVESATEAAPPVFGTSGFLAAAATTHCGSCCSSSGMLFLI